MTIRISCQALLLLVAAFFYIPQVTAQSQPLIAFSDLISGPSEGLNDGKGEGAIVTLWAYHLSTSPGRVLVTDSTGTTRQAAYVYYWKRADGQSPSGPADLYSSHQLHEVAFSLPKSANGPATISLENSNGIASAPHPFTIRAGNIYHVKPNGSNNTGDGSFSNPWAFINGWDSRSSAPGNRRLNAGDTVYTHGVKEPVLGDSTRDVAMYLRALEGTLSHQIAIVSYPGATSIVESPKWGIQPYLSSGIVISKYKVLAGMLDDPMDDRPTFGAGPQSDSTIHIRTSANGRVIGNYISDAPGKCSNGLAGAIYSTRMDGSNVKAFGNFLHKIGCKQTSHFHHTTYMSKRTADGQPPSQAWEFGWNRFEDNMAVFGIHFYDQSPYDARDCDPVVGTFRVHNNFIRNQRGSAVNIYTTDYDRVGSCWNADTEIFNNIMINVGLGPVAEINNGTQPYAISIGGDIDGDYRIYNNLIYTVSDQSARDYETPSVFRLRNRFAERDLIIENNIIQTNYPMNMFRNQTNVDVQASANIWYTGDGSISASSTFFEDLSSPLVTNPMVIISDTISLATESPAIGAASSRYKTERDFYGRAVFSPSNIGPIGSTTNPPSPPKDIAIQ